MKGSRECYLERLSRDWGGRRRLLWLSPQVSPELYHLAPVVQTIHQINHCAVNEPHRKTSCVIRWIVISKAIRLLKTETWTLAIAIFDIVFEFRKLTNRLKQTFFHSYLFWTKQRRENGWVISVLVLSKPRPKISSSPTSRSL